MSGPLVLQAMAGAAHGGAEAFFTRLVIALARAGLDQRVVIRPHPERMAALMEAGLSPLPLAFGGPLDLVSRVQLWRLIRRHRPQIVLSWMNRATHAVPPRQLRPAGTLHLARLGGYYPLKYYRRCDHLIANTRDIADYLIRGGWPPARVHYLPNFVAAERAPPIDRASLGTPADAKVILALGRLHANKGFDLAVQALAQLPAAYLWLAGEGPLRQELEGQVRALGVGDRVRFLGWREDVAALMAAADLLLCPSRHEPLGNVVIEAWAQALPVVAAAAAGPAALIRDGENGLLAPIEDSSALAAAVARLFAEPDLARRLAAGGEASYRSEFTEAVVVQRYLALFQGLTGSCAASPE